MKNFFIIPAMFPALALAADNIQFNTFTAPELKVNIACSSVTNAGATLNKVMLGQTHLLERQHPFYYMTNGRPAAVQAIVSGTGNSPQVSVEGMLGGQSLGKVCASGPTQLPGAFTASIPAAWVVPGASIVVATGTSSQTIDLNVQASPTLSLMTMDWLLYGNTTPIYTPPTLGTSLASVLPVSKVQLAKFPLKPAINKLPIAPTTDGQTPAGVATNIPATWATIQNHCTAADKTAKTCTPYNGLAEVRAIRGLTGKIQEANGYNSIHWYGALSKISFSRGGLGGGMVGAGDDYSLTFIHELGHEFDMPHWGDYLYTRSTEIDRRHPYTGSNKKADGTPLGGGFGDSTSIDPTTTKGLVPPLCAGKTYERQEPMQRQNNCLVTGQGFDVFSDYSALFIHRYFVGASASYTGTVPYPRDQLGNLNPPFAFPAKSGKLNLMLDATGQGVGHQKFNNGYYNLTPANVGERLYKTLYPEQWNVPVYTLYGSYSNVNPEFNTIQTPLKYTGNYRHLWDPTTADGFADLKLQNLGDGCWFGCDLVAEATYVDGTVRRAVIKGKIRGTDPLNSNSFGYWAVNFLADKELARAALYYRPMQAQNSAGNLWTAPETINGPNAVDASAATYLGECRSGSYASIAALNKGQ